MRVRLELHSTRQHQRQPEQWTTKKKEQRNLNNTLAVRANIFNNNKKRPLLGHVEQCLVPVEPQVVVGNAHLVECDLFGVFKKTVWTPNLLKPIDVQNTVIGCHIFGQAKAMVTPTLTQKDIGHVSLVCQKRQNIQEQ